MTGIFFAYLLVCGLSGSCVVIADGQPNASILSCQQSLDKTWERIIKGPVESKLEEKIGEFSLQTAAKGYCLLPGQKFEVISKKYEV